MISQDAARVVLIGSVVICVLPDENEARNTFALIVFQAAARIVINARAILFGCEGCLVAVGCAVCKSFVGDSFAALNNFECRAVCLLRIFKCFRMNGDCAVLSSGDVVIEFIITCEFCRNIEYEVIVVFFEREGICFCLVSDAGFIIDNVTVFAEAIGADCARERVGVVIVGCSLSAFFCSLDCFGSFFEGGCRGFRDLIVATHRQAVPFSIFVFAGSNIERLIFCRRREEFGGIVNRDGVFSARRGRICNGDNRVEVFACHRGNVGGKTESAAEAEVVCACRAVIESVFLFGAHARSRSGEAGLVCARALVSVGGGAAAVSLRLRDLIGRVVIAAVSKTAADNFRLLSCLLVFAFRGDLFRGGVEHEPIVVGCDFDVTGAGRRRS